MRYKIGKKAIRQTPVIIKSVDKDKHTLTMIASTQDVDRHGDTVIQSGWSLNNFKKNPVILNSHKYDDATEVIAKAIKTEIVGNGKKSKLVQEWEFAVEENPKARVIFDLYAGGFLNSSSVGFIPKKFKTAKDGSVDYYTIEEAELLEVSAVSVPANAMALAKQKGIDVEPLENEIVEEDEVEEDIEEVEEENEIEEVEEEKVEDDEIEEVIEEVVESKKVSYSKIINKLNEEETNKLIRARKAINKLLENTTVKENRKREINKAVRSLLSIK